MTWLDRFLGTRPDPRAGAVLSLACPLCRAEPGTPCDPWSEAASLALPPCGLCGDPPRCPLTGWCDAAAGVSLPGGDPDAALHTARVLAAIRAGLVTREGVLAQFAPGRGPHSLTNTTDQEART